MSDRPSKATNPRTGCSQHKRWNLAQLVKRLKVNIHGRRHNSLTSNKDLRGGASVAHNDCHVIGSLEPHKGKNRLPVEELA